MLMLEAPTSPPQTRAVFGRVAHQQADGRGAGPGGRAAMPHAGPNTPPGDVAWHMVIAGLRRLGRALCDDVHEAEELAQQAVAQVLERAPERGPHAGYLRQTLIRLWLDQRRSARRELKRRAMIAADRISRAVGARLERQEDLERVRIAMDLLPPRQRAALAMRLVEQLSYDVIAEAMGTDVRAARSNVHLARKHLRAVLEDRP